MSVPMLATAVRRRAAAVWMREDWVGVEGAEMEALQAVITSATASSVSMQAKATRCLSNNNISHTFITPFYFLSYY